MSSPPFVTRVKHLGGCIHQDGAQGAIIGVSRSASDASVCESFWRSVDLSHTRRISDSASSRNASQLSAREENAQTLSTSAHQLTHLGTAGRHGSNL